MELRMLFKEQWLGLSVLAASSENMIKAAESIEAAVNECLKSMEPDSFSKHFVPLEEDRKAICTIGKHLNIKVKWHEYENNLNYKPPPSDESDTDEGPQFSQLGFLILRLTLNRESASECPEIRPNHTQQIIHKVWDEIKKQGISSKLLLDNLSPPYVFTICTDYRPSEPRVGWESATVAEHKHEIGQWAEIYSGQFPDYRHSLYESRIDGDISNRKSEIHILRRNSAFLFMEEDNYGKFFLNEPCFLNVSCPGSYESDCAIPKEYRAESTCYIYRWVIIPIMRIRTIQFALVKLSIQVDSDLKMMSTGALRNRALDSIKAELNRTDEYRGTLQRLLAPFHTDLTRSHRQHYTTVLEKAMEFSRINESWSRVSEKVRMNTEQLAGITMRKQEETLERQQSLLNKIQYVLLGGITLQSVDIFMGGVLRRDLVVTPVGVLVILCLLLVLVSILSHMRLEKRQKKANRPSMVRRTK